MPSVNSKILLADDNSQALRFFVSNLQSAGFDVIAVKNSQEIFPALEAKVPDLILLNCRMQELDDVEVCAHIRAVSSIPLMVITGYGKEEVRVRALEFGADDCLTPPFDVVELLARIRALLRRSGWSKHGNVHDLGSTATFGHLSVDFIQNRVTIDDKPIALTPIEFRLLAFLVRNAGRIVTQNLLLEHIWGLDYIGESNLLKVNITRLRHKIEPDPAHPSYIVTKTGLGYLFSAQPDPLQGKEAGGELGLIRGSL